MSASIDKNHGAGRLRLDHLILRVADPEASAQFYRRTLGLAAERGESPFLALRLAPDCVIDLLPQAPRDPAHLALHTDRAGFEAVRTRLRTLRIGHGGGPFVRDGRAAAQYGARGWGEALYFHDLDGHNIEVRTYDPC
ncbi:VOC family protein [Lysobacter sp. BMK333-48F3]|uniref:VOC family protein n=1 Tax=Lysobacter sp. BMK333-48F3 TaxID=2867962 RepID=UPI001C8C582A|nr:VOC family protein [Lysobacter sp. BMK333-48F3]MBX9401279.1 VOC family protein [Lysobacter sp. BMK333-48F3]